MLEAAEKVETSTGRAALEGVAMVAGGMEEVVMVAAGVVMETMAVDRELVEGLLVAHQA